MNAYSVDVRGNVVAASKVVDLKVKELLKAQEALTVAKMLATVYSDRSNHETRPVKRVVAYRLTAKRLNAFLHEFRKYYQVSKLPNIVNVKATCIRLKNAYPKKFCWCNKPPESMLSSLLSYIQTNF